jgi:hypothetical protein
MCRHNKIPINNIQIFNPLLGITYTASIKDWTYDQGNKLIQYLLWKKQLLSNRTNNIITKSFESLINEQLILDNLRKTNKDLSELEILQLFSSIVNS